MQSLVFKVELHAVITRQMKEVHNDAYTQGVYILVISLFFSCLICKYRRTTDKNIKLFFFQSVASYGDYKPLQ
jgi:hypothetical protein